MAGRFDGRDAGPFGFATERQRRDADLFFADLMGWSEARSGSTPGTSQSSFREQSSGEDADDDESGPGCSLWLSPVASASYTDWIAAPTKGRLSLLINGRNSNGTAPDIDVNEPLVEMEAAVKALGTGDFCYLSAWFFEPATVLLAGAHLGETTWGGLLRKKAELGVEIRVLINDFDPFTKLDTWEQTRSLTPLEAVVRALPTASRGRFKYLVTRHPANYGGARAAVIRSLSGVGGSGPIFIGSHHQKFMVTRRGDETTAFCGGLDIESRKTPPTWSYASRGLIGWHDLTLKMEGPITRDLERQFVERWNREQAAARNALLPGWGSWGTLALPAALPAADDTAAKRVQDVQVTRTISSDAMLSAYSNNRNDVRAAYRNLVRCASSFVYLENQYFRDLSLADEIAARGRAIPDLRALLVVLADATVDDTDNPLTAQGVHLQHQFFERVTAAFGPRAAVYTMFRRSVHAKVAMADDRVMSIGSANANVRSFDLDSEMNLSIDAAEWTRAARLKLWAHNLGVGLPTVTGWAVADFIPRWNAVASANAALTASPDRMAGEGVLIHDWLAITGTSSALVPDYLVNLDVRPMGNRLYGLPAGPEPRTGRTAVA